MREDCSKRWGRSMRTDEQQCLSMNTVLTVLTELTEITSGHATVYSESRQARYDYEGCCSLTAL